MTVHIAFLRGINVGGHHKLPMRELVGLLEGLGFESARTYIQSGNAVFRSDREDTSRMADDIRDAIGERYGFRPRVYLLGRGALRGAMDVNPFPEAEEDPKTLQLFFLDRDPGDIDFGPLEAVQTVNERFALIGSVFYLHAPDGIGRSKLVERVGRGWDVELTARNWRTVGKVMDMADAVAADG